MDLAFDHLAMFHLLWAVPVLGFVYWWGFARNRRALGRFATLNLLRTLIPSVSIGRRRFKAVMVLSAVAMLVVALSGPRWGTHWEEVQRRGIDIIFVLDVSNSMLAEDDKPNRLERAKLDIKDMLEVLPGDRVGLVAYAGKSALVCPLTVNYGSFRLALEEVGTYSAQRGGTNIGDAVRHAMECFVDKVKDHKAIIILSDGGEEDESYATEAAQKAFEERGIRVFTVGYGDMVEGGRIPVIRDGQRVYMQFEGQEVWTKLNPSTLQAMAAVADGGFFTNTDFREVYERIVPKVASREFEVTRKEMRYARFHWFAALALTLLMIDTLITDRKASGGMPSRAQPG
ncbi:MAG: VWA domain-containing protein [Planctomycetes bacterium]|nr:VWA domain-containing protein [Planctomycetota bacterium]